MPIERRKTMRRQSDRDLLARLEELQRQVSGEMTREQRHLRRRAIRHNCEASIGLQIATNYGGADTWKLSEYPIPGRLLDLSSTGCSIFSKHQMATGDRLVLSVNLLKGPVIQCSGTVRWTKAVAEHNGYANGVEFTDISSENRAKIEAFLKHLETKLGLPAGD